MSASPSESLDQSASAQSGPAKHVLPPRPPALLAFKPRAVAPPVRQPASTAQYNCQYPTATPDANTYPSATSTYSSYGAGASSYLDPSQQQYPQGFPANSPYSLPEYGAQVKQWQSQYASRPAARPDYIAPPKAPDSSTSASASRTAKSASSDNRTVVRVGGGKTWEDPTLLEWPADHHRLFIGNLAGEVTDESLLKAFLKYPSVSKARVIRDPSSTKSKGYGFVSLADSDEYFQAAKEMQGKYIGSHPVTISRANDGGRKGATKVVVKDEKYYKKYHHKGRKGVAGHTGGSQQKPQQAPQQSQGEARDVLKADSKGGIRKVAKGSQNKIKLLG